MTAYLLVENKGRELASRLLIAKALVDRGVHVVLGEQKAISAALLNQSSGVVLHKGINRIAANAMLRMPSLTHVAIEEEAFGLRSFDDRGHDKRAPIRELYVNNFLDDYRKSYPAILTGNPRADLCGMPELWADEARAIRDKHGSFVLVNTNTGIINSRWGDIGEVVSVFKRIGWPDTPRDITAIMVRHAQNMANVVAVVDELTRWKVKVVLRPHPSEVPETWRRLVKAGVVTEGWHLPWIAASECVLHTGCTTAYEASLMGKPAIEIRDVDRAVEQVLARPQGHEPTKGDAHQVIAERIAALDRGPSDITIPSVDRTDYERDKMTASLDEVEALYRRMGGRGEIRQLGGSVFEVRT